jgi:Spy/CpxP family protein refolding chaperone
MQGKINSILIGFAMFLVFCATADAQMGRGRGGAANTDSGFAAGCIMNMNLSAEQSVKIQELRNSFFKDTTSLRTEIFRKDQELDALMLEPSAELEKAKKLQDEISGMQTQMEQKRLQAEFEVRKVLTPDQLKQLPPGCGMGIGMCGRNCGMMPGCGMGQGMGGGMGRMGRGGPMW